MKTQVYTGLHQIGCECLPGRNAYKKEWIYKAREELRVDQCYAVISTPPPLNSEAENQQGEPWQPEGLLSFCPGAQPVAPEPGVEE